MERWQGLSAIGLLIALLMLSGCTQQGAAAGANATRSVVPTAAATRMAARSTITTGGPATGMSIMHTVQDGENLYRIARKYGTSVQAIAQANGITDVTLITTGQKIAIPNIQATTEPEPTETPTITPTPIPATPWPSACGPGSSTGACASWRPAGSTSRSAGIF